MWEEYENENKKECSEDYTNIHNKRFSPLWRRDLRRDFFCGSLSKSLAYADQAKMEMKKVRNGRNIDYGAKDGPRWAGENLWPRAPSGSPVRMLYKFIEDYK